MSVADHSRRFDSTPVTSGLPREADNSSAGRDFAFVPTAVIVGDLGLSARSGRSVVFSASITMVHRKGDDVKSGRIACT